MFLHKYYIIIDNLSCTEVTISLKYYKYIITFIYLKTTCITEWLMCKKCMCCAIWMLWGWLGVESHGDDFILINVELDEWEDYYELLLMSLEESNGCLLLRFLYELLFLKVRSFNRDLHF